MPRQSDVFTTGLISKLRGGRFFLCLCLLFLSSCASPTGVVRPTAAAATPSASPPAGTPHAPELRFALIGSLTGANVWALFDAAGYSYNDYAVRSGYWPRLYDLTVPERTFQPQAASGMPSPVQADGTLFSGTVQLRPDLKWTDGSPFTADDVAFTVNTAISFQLGFDWHAYYDPDWLARAEAVDAHTVKFYFKHAPGVAQWQYGVLQGPIVQKSYWSSRIADAAALLPTAASVAQIEVFNAQVATLQSRVRDLITTGSTATGDEARQLQFQLQRQQGDLDQARNQLSKAQTGVDEAMASARQALYSVSAEEEPTLGTWMPSERTSTSWANGVNPAHPFGLPNFDIVTYTSYPDEASALDAVKNGEVNGILEANGLSPELASRQIPGAHIISNASSSSHFLVINPLRPAWQTSVLRRALFCAIDRGSLADSIPITPLDSLVLPGNDWLDIQAVVPCGAGTTSSHMQAVALLKEAGYTWIKEPTDQGPGGGLTAPDGLLVPPLRLLAPDPGSDAQAAAVAQRIQDDAQYLGITLTVQPVEPAEIRYAVFSSGEYDMAIVGWRLSVYPGYLCDWFGDGNPFGYSIPQVQADCAALSTTSDLAAARKDLYDIQAVFAQDPPIIPLYSGLTFDVLRGLAYPSDHLTDGLGGAYGAPSLAIPVPP